MASYTAKYFALIGVLLACNVYANAFSCGDSDPAACKTKFTEEFSADFRTLHLNAMRQFFTTFIDIAKVISNELPETDAVKPQLDEAAAKISKNLENLNKLANTDDIKNIAEIISQSMDDMGLQAMKKGKISEDFNELAKKHHFKEALMEVIAAMHMDTAKLWAEAYSGLRAEDKKTYPAYGFVNNLMEKIRVGDDKTPRVGLYINTISMLALEFNMEYLKDVATII